VDDHSSGYLPHIVDDDDDILENWDDDDDDDDDNLNKDPNSDDSVVEVFPPFALWSSLHNVVVVLYQFD